jgi:hypothetical protein
MWNGMICNQDWSTISRRDRNAMAGKPEVTFEALNTEFKKFGVFGFMDGRKRQAF